MKLIFTICLFFLFSGIAFGQDARSENSSTLNPTGCPTLIPMGSFTICEQPTTTITPIVQTVGSAPVVYSWQIPPSATIVGGTNNMHLITYYGGTYTLSAMNANTGCTSVRTYFVEVCANVGIEEEIANRVLAAVYPNPGSDKFVLELRENAAALIYNSAGALILAQDCDMGLTELFLTELSKGIYYLRIKTDGYSKAIKLLKQ